MKNGILLKAIGLLWAVGAGLLLVTEVLEQLQSEFWLGWVYYILVWGFFVFCVVSGVLLVLGWHRSRALLSFAAVMAALYNLFMLTKYGAESEAIFIVMNILLVAFAVSTLLVVRKMPPNPGSTRR